ncbi:DgyrCDS4495 [Dimorphilus gyrociliatus]|uniref:DgyrCDS4495 n=1 Tax=Dimorphilus gyrociliatus TaxID=2664684 RepID=A0A7I8VH82_9ANNE|nr:DgyrCDS4495 [Dimorphilus gyrociliatus]
MEDNSYLAIDSPNFLKSYLRKETEANRFWREGYRAKSFWYSTGNCSVPIKSVNDSCTLSNDLRIKWNRNLEMNAEHTSKLFDYVCERELPSSVLDCAETCEYCTIDESFQSVCICPKGRLGSQCQWPCMGNFFGEDCNTPCGNCKFNKCNSKSGKCLDNCQDGWMGENCNRQLITNTTDNVQPTINTKLLAFNRKGNSTKTNEKDDLSDGTKQDIIIGIVAGTVCIAIIILIGIYVYVKKTTVRGQEVFY